MPRTAPLVSGLLMVCLACAFVMSDEPPPKQEAPPQAKIAAVKQAEAKKSNEKGKKEEAKAPAGYEDAPAAGERPPKQEAPPRAKKAAFKQAEAKKSDEKGKKEKAKAPAGYEDAPTAGDPPPARKAAAGQVLEVRRDALVEARAVDAQVAKREKQLLPQFAPLMTAELSFVNRVCDLNLEQRKKIKAASVQCLQGAARQYALAQSGMNRGQVKGRPQVIPNPTNLLHQALAKVLQETLQPQQRAAYDDEMAKRKAHRKQVTVESVVAMIDERLVLTIDQRQKLTESLDKNWQSTWVQSLDMLLNNNQYLPIIPDQFVVPTLTETQQRVWRTVPKNNYASWGGFARGNQGAVDDFPLVETAADVERTSAN